MSEQFDNIENSVRNAFKDFELSVSETDWQAIEKNILPTKKRRLIWWFNTFTGKTLSILLGLGISSVAIWFASESNTKIAKINNASNSTSTVLTQQHTHGVLKVHKKQSLSSTQVVNAKKSSFAQGNEQARNTSIKQNGINNPEKINTINNADKVQGIVKNNDLTPPEVEKNKLAVNPFGIRASIQVMALKLLKLFHWEIKHKEIHIKPTIYGNVAIAMSKNKVQTNQSTGIWEGTTILAGNKSSINIRLEGGVSVKKGNLTYKIGAAVDGNLPGNASSDTIRIKIPTQTLPYMDVQGNVLYWLATRWKDSTIVLANRNRSTWIEIPITVQHNWKISNKNRFIAAVVLLPGMRVSASGTVANPYLYQPSSYWQYNYNIKADTNSITANAAEFQNKGRLGAGLQVGFERETANIYWGVSVSNRYYFTPTWKEGFPLKQNTHNIGIQFNIGIKLQ